MPVAYTLSGSTGQSVDTAYGLEQQAAYSMTSETADNSEWESDDTPEFPKTNNLSIRGGYMLSLGDYVSLNPF